MITLLILVTYSSPMLSKGDKSQEESFSPLLVPLLFIKVTDEFFTFLCCQGREQVGLSQLCKEGCTHRKPSSPSFLFVVSAFPTHKQITCAILSSEKSPKG